MQEDGRQMQGRTYHDDPMHGWICGKGDGMKVLVACEFSGRVRDAFIARGHDTVSCDLLPTEQPGPHIQDDVLDHLDGGWDLMVGHPPCRYIANSGVRWLCSKEYLAPVGIVHNPRYWEMVKARDFFMKLLQADIPKICIENPIPHKYAELPKYNQIIHPWQFGHSEKKSTCLWLKNLPKLVPLKFVDNRKNPDRNESVFREPPGPDRWKNRSRTFQGIADAMADQWGATA